MKFLIKLVIFIVVVVALVGGYLGLVPGVSSLFGSDKPRDLKAAYTEADLVSAQSKLKQQLVEPGSQSPAEVLKNAPVVSASTSLTAKEFAAHFDAIHPVSDVQVLFHDDGTFEATGRIDKDRIAAYAQLIGYTDSSAKTIIDELNQYLPASPVFYLKGEGKIVNNQPSLTLTAAELGRAPVPTSEAAQALVSYAQLAISSIQGLKFNNLSIENSELKFDGTVPKEFPKW